MFIEVKDKFGEMQTVNLLKVCRLINRAGEAVICFGPSPYNEILAVEETYESLRDRVNRALGCTTKE